MLSMEWNATEIASAHSRHERHVRDLDYLALPNALLVLLVDKLVLPRGWKGIERVKLRRACMF